jgi:alanine racemase
MRAFAEIDIAALKANLATIKARAGASRVMAVVKADAYGHGLLPCARAAQEAGAQWLGVALLEEALTLRSAGIKSRVLAWLCPPGSDFDEALRQDIDISISSHELLIEVIDSGKRVGVRPRVHLEIDTGLSRGGVLGSLDLLVEELKIAQDNKMIEVVGAWSHFARADEPGEAMNQEQVERYRSALQTLLNAGLKPPIHHLSNSAALFSIPDGKFEMVRTGIALYGLSPENKNLGSSEDLGLIPVMTLKAKLYLVKELPKGSTVGYGAIGKVDRDTKIGVVAMGYSDGIPRNADSSVGVFVGGRRAPIIGRVSMDQFVVDLGADSTVKAGEIVTVFSGGLQGEYTADDWAKACGTINYEIVTRIGPRVPRISINDKPADT